MYIGVTNNLENRIWEHRNGTGSEFAKKYRATRLVYVEEYDNPTDAIAREKQLKGWRRERKNELVRTINPTFRDLMPSGHPERSEGSSIGDGVAGRSARSFATLRTTERTQNDGR